MLKLKYYSQDRTYTCGPTCLKMVFEFFGKKIREGKLVKLTKTKKSGTSHRNMIKVSRRHGFYCYVHNDASLNQVRHFIDLKLPVIVNFTEPDGNEGHYAVVIGYKHGKIIMNDPWNGKNFKMNSSEFKRRWYDYHKHHKYTNWLLVLSRKQFNIGKQYFPL
ncbi:MAG: cysteine peptidase family C39 domain-containing protein [Candidatus Pacearchaeota archaeon]